MWDLGFIWGSEETIGGSRVGKGRRQKDKIINLVSLSVIENLIFRKTLLLKTMENTGKIFLKMSLMWQRANKIVRNYLSWIWETRLQAQLTGLVLPWSIYFWFQKWLRGWTVFLATNETIGFCLMVDELASSSPELEKVFLIVENLGMRMFIRVLCTLAENWKACNF